jgi:hypothetical protein
VCEMLHPPTLQAEPAEAPDAAPKRGPHRWVRGQSGNPAGAKKHVCADGRSVRQHAMDCTPAALAFLIQAMADPKVPVQTRVAAATAILRTGHADATAETIVADRVPRVVYVEKFASSGPVPGVLASPVREDISLPRRSIHMPRLTLDADASEEMP